MSQKMTRRQAVGGIATLTLGGVTLSALGTDSARAEGVTVDGFSIDDVSHESPDGMVDDVDVSVSADYAFETTTDIDDLRLELTAGRSENSQWEIAAETIDESGTQGSGTATLDAPLTWSQDYQIADFRPPDGGDEVVQKPVFVLRAIVTAGGEELDTSEATTQATVTVTNTKEVLELAVGGTGSIDVKE